MYIQNKTVILWNSYSKGRTTMNDILYQKLGITINQIAQDFMGRERGDRIPSISEYQAHLQVARGTIQNALNYLKDERAIVLRNRGTLGTYIEHIDYSKLQQACIIKSILGIMPLPYSSNYQGIATALYDALSELDCNLAYVRGSEERIRMVEQGVYQFALCSQAAAEKMIADGSKIKVVLNFGKESYLTKHVLLLRDPKANGVEDGMRIAYDKSSLDQRMLIYTLTKKKKNIRYIDIRSHQTITAIAEDRIDAGVWNYDEIVEGNYKDLHMISLDNFEETDEFNRAVLIIRRGEDAVEQILMKYIDVNKVHDIQELVRQGKIIANF